VLQTIFMPKSDATKSVWYAFENYVVFVIYVYICLCVSLLPVFWRIKVFIKLIKGRARLCRPRPPHFPVSPAE